MNYTEKYHLPQWVETDRIMMEDFNAAMASIEGGMTANAQAVEQAAQLPYVVGSYTGDGATYRTITLGFPPRIVIICKAQNTPSATYAGLGVMVAGAHVHSEHIYLTENGFRLDSHNTTLVYPEVNKSGVVYDYLAFR